MRVKRRKGMTLLEIMAVVVIIGILATIVTMYVDDAISQAKVDTTKSQLASLDDAIRLYKMNQNSLPSKLEDLVNPPSSGGSPGRKYLETVPKDAWNRDFVYKVLSANDYDCISYGADGKPGGSGYDADISIKSIKERK